MGRDDMGYALTTSHRWRAVGQGMNPVWTRLLDFYKWDANIKIVCFQVQKIICQQGRDNSSLLRANLITNSCMLDIVFSTDDQAFPKTDHSLELRVTEQRQ